MNTTSHWFEFIVSLSPNSGLIATAKKLSGIFGLSVPEAVGVLKVKSFTYRTEDSVKAATILSLLKDGGVDYIAYERKQEKDRFGNFTDNCHANTLG